MESLKLKQHADIRFLFTEGCSATVTNHLSVVVYSESFTVNLQSLDGSQQIHMGPSVARIFLSFYWPSSQFVTSQDERKQRRRRYARSSTIGMLF